MPDLSEGALPGIRDLLVVRVDVPDVQNVCNAKMVCER